MKSAHALAIHPVTGVRVPAAGRGRRPILSSS